MSNYSFKGMLFGKKIAAATDGNYDLFLPSKQDRYLNYVTFSLQVSLRDCNFKMYG